MNTMHLKYAIEVANTGSITQAAENLFMAQPNLSKAIKEMEESIGIDIFERTSRGVAPTKIGLDFLRYAKSIIEQVDSIEHLSATKHASLQKFSISVARGSYVTLAFTKFISTLDPKKEIDIKFQETNSMQIIRSIIDNNVNIGIIRYRNNTENYFLDYLKEKEISYLPLWEFEYVLVVSKDSPLATIESLKYEDLKNYIELTHGDKLIPYVSPKHPNIKNKSNKLKKIVYLYERGSQFDILSSVPNTYMWVSPIPDEIINRNGLVLRKCVDTSYSHKDVLIFQKNYKFTKLDERFLDLLYKSRDDISNKKYM